MSETERKEVDVMDDDIIVTLAFEDGTEEKCVVIGLFEVEGKEYIALEPSTEEDIPYLYGYKELSEDEFQLVEIADDEEFAKVVKEFERLMSEEE